MGAIGTGTQNRITWSAFVLLGLFWASPIRATEDNTPQSADADATAATPASADESPETSGAQTRARQAYALGQEAFINGDYRTAAQYFMQANDYVSHPSALKMVAECYAGMGDVAAALNMMTALLNNDQYPEPDLLRDRVSELKTQAGRLKIEVTPADGVIEVDGLVLAQQGQAVLYVNPGDRTIAATLEGIHREKTVTVSAGEEKSVKIDLTSKSATDTETSAGNPSGTPSEPSLTEQDSVEVDSTSEELPRAFWAASAIAGIGLVAGTVFGTMALRDEQDFDEAPRQGTMDSGNRAAVIADVSFGIALGAAIAGTIVLVSEKKKRAQKKASKTKATNIMFHPTAGHRGAGFVAGMNF